MSELTNFFVRHYTLVLDNEESTHREVARISRDVVVGSGVTRMEYEAMSEMERQDRYADEIGERVADFIDTLASDENGQMPMIVSEIMMNHSSDVQWQLGKRYTPDPIDVEDYLNEDY